MKILVVDDSALVRRALTEILALLPRAEVLTARNGEEALAQLATFDPDVVTLDVNMPKMDGLTCLAHIMNDSPRPVVMVSSITAADSIPALEALSMGAVAVLEKPGGSVSRHLGDIGEEIRRSVLAASKARVRKPTASFRGSTPPRPAMPRESPRVRGAPVSGSIVLIGVSTGGPAALEVVLPNLPSDIGCPVVVAQHMPGTFTKSFAARLDQHCGLTVVEVDRPVPLAANTVHIIHGSSDGLIERRLGRPTLVPVATDPKYPWHPSVDRLVASALEVCDPASMLGVLLTGMGDDGAKTMTELSARGGHTIAEAESSAVVFGMPRELARRGGAKEVRDLGRIADAVASWAAKRVKS